MNEAFKPYIETGELTEEEVSSLTPKQCYDFFCQPLSLESKVVTAREVVSCLRNNDHAKLWAVVSLGGIADEVKELSGKKIITQEDMRQAFLFLKNSCFDATHYWCTLSNHVEEWSVLIAANIFTLNDILTLICSLHDDKQCFNLFGHPSLLLLVLERAAFFANGAITLKEIFEKNPILLAPDLGENFHSSQLIRKAGKEEKQKYPEHSNFSWPCIRECLKKEKFNEKAKERLIKLTGKDCYHFTFVYPWVKQGIITLDEACDHYLPRGLSSRQQVRQLVKKSAKYKAAETFLCALESAIADGDKETEVTVAVGFKH